MSTERKEGYYPIQYASSQWEIAFWNGKYWRLIGVKGRFEEELVDVICEVRIEMPDDIVNDKIDKE